MTEVAAFVGRLKKAEQTFTSSRRKILTRCAEVGVVAIKAAPGYPQGNVAGKKFPQPRVKVTDDAAYIKVGQAGRLVNDPTKAHVIAPKRRRGKGRRSAIAFGGVVRASVRHPGTKGKHFMEKGRATAEPLIAKTYQRALHSELAGIFKGD